MKKTLLKMFMLTAIFAVFGCLSAFAQSDDEAGGYVKTPVNDARVKAAANYAITVKAKEMKETLRFQSIKRAETQVVAGMNYQVCMVIYVPSKQAQTDGVTLYIDATIYQNLQGQYKLSAWDDSDDNCGVEQ